MCQQGNAFAEMIIEEGRIIYDKQKKSEAQRGFHQAYFDLRACRWNIEGGFHDKALILAQQAGEKALKSLLFRIQEKSFINSLTRGDGHGGGERK